MYKPISLFIAIRYLWSTHLPIFKKIITILSIIGISISTASLIIIMSIINGSEENFKKNVLSFIPHLIITNKNQYVKKTMFPKNILKFNNVEKISDFISKEIIVQSKNNISIAEIIGIDNTNYYNTHNYNIKNILNTLKPKFYNIIIGKQLAKKLNVHIGDTVKLILLSNKKKIFNKHMFKIINIFSTKSEVDYYQILMNKEDSLNFLNYSKNYVTGWRIWLKNPLSLNINTIRQTIDDFILLDWKMQKGELFKAIKIEKYIMLFLFFLILLVSVLNIFIILTVYIIEKKNAIAILKTQGLMNWKIMLIFVIFGSSNAIIGNILGTIISIVLIVQNNFLKFFIDIFFDETNIPIIIIPSQVFLINIFSVLLAIFSTLYPSWNAVQLKPAKILSNE
ncbi:lipoprotein-releasing ABC transporter permease subunit [Buchnera aphidicola (Acyrthosiphon lactucae)]|uniref:Lipoprotein-releasing ABC transporter permease subunit n=1 Tax=Buchnera aphidicola (Acyrthosiphon lactucae) TaxID=1241832 RepID=A0A4D6XVS8_9GAMM|nr:lipoprotein-releasing ABC transporter permease subunit [Buchnera aphidicola]QCI17691.1 lipoprotein-releasing ABC transporter permease subunit [Buchnera aphidicola (Acyrthosiphon lactucae)]